MLIKGVLKNRMVTAAALKGAIPRRFVAMAKARHLLIGRPTPPGGGTRLSRSGRVMCLFTCAAAGMAANARLVSEQGHGGWISLGVLGSLLVAPAVVAFSAIYSRLGSREGERASKRRLIGKVMASVAVKFASKLVSASGKRAEARPTPPPPSSSKEGVYVRKAGRGSSSNTALAAPPMVVLPAGGVPVTSTVKTAAPLPDSPMSEKSRCENK
jgi:hypothetical protein